MTLGTKSLLALSVSAALFGAACKKKDPAAGSGSATGSGTATAAATVDAAAAAPAIDAAEAAPAAVDAAEAAGGGGGGAASLTPELKAVFDTITPILAMPAGDDKNKAGCKAAETIVGQMRAVDKNPPAGVDAAAWTAVAESMSGGMNDFQIECAEEGSPNFKALSDALETAKEFEALVAKKGQ
jgi:hypothetical protein